VSFLTHGVEHSVRHSEELFYHWQGRHISITADPPQPVHIDGEVVGSTPVSVDILPKAIRVLVPKAG